MKYCTSCGAMSGRKVCKACGVKENKEHKYCGWCGEPLNENASVCTKCGSKVKPNILAKPIGIIGGVFMLFMAYIAFMARQINVAEYVSAAVLFTVGGILCLPSMGRLIHSLLLDKKVIRKIASIARVVIAIVCLLAGFNLMVKEAGRQPSHVYKQNATKAALTVFHETVKLKNEDSFELNGSKVYSDDEPYKGYDNLRLVKVALDYTAQNGFGGSTRETYMITMYFDTRNGYYYREDGTRID